jgi:hypothetical protein
MESYLKPSTGGNTAKMDIGLSTPTGSKAGVSVVVSFDAKPFVGVVYRAEGYRIEEGNI